MDQIDINIYIMVLMPMQDEMDELYDHLKAINPDLVIEVKPKATKTWTKYKRTRMNQFTRSRQHRLMWRR